MCVQEHLFCSQNIIIIGDSRRELRERQHLSVRDGCFDGRSFRELGDSRRELREKLGDSRKRNSATRGENSRRELREKLGDSKIGFKRLT